MKCRDAEFAICADPDRPSAESLDHVRACRACADLQHRELAFNARLRRAMSVPVPPAVMAQSWLSPRKRGLDRGWAAAACVAVVSMMVGWSWIATKRIALADDLVAHVAHEPATRNDDAATTAAQLNAVLKGAGLRLTDPIPRVSHVEKCWIRGQRVLHLVVQTVNGPVTVIVLPNETTFGRYAFVADRYRGILMPAARGSLFALAAPGEHVDAVARQFVSSLQVET